MIPEQETEIKQAANNFVCPTGKGRHTASNTCAAPARCLSGHSWESLWDKEQERAVQKTMKVSVSFLAPQEKQTRKGAALTPGMGRPAARAQPWRSPPGWRSRGSAGSSRTPRCCAELCGPEPGQTREEELSGSDSAGGGPGDLGLTPRHTNLWVEQRELALYTGPDKLVLLGATSMLGSPAMSALGHYSKKGAASEELNPSESLVTAGLQSTGIMDHISYNCSTTNPPRLLLNFREYFK